MCESKIETECNVNINVNFETETSLQVNRTMVDNEAQQKVHASRVGMSEECGHLVVPSSVPTDRVGEN